MEVLEISERYDVVWNTLSSLRKTATGPDQIPSRYWVRKDQAEIFTLATHQWPRMMEKGNHQPIAKGYVPVERGDFRPEESSV